MSRFLMTLSIWEFLIKVKWEAVTLTGEVKATAPALIYNLSLSETYSKCAVTEWMHCAVTSGENENSYK